MLHDLGVYSYNMIECTVLLEIFLLLFSIDVDVAHQTTHFAYVSMTSKVSKRKNQA